VTPLSPRLLKGGLVQIDPDTSKVLRVIALQYNPDSLSRTVQVQATGETGERSEDDQARSGDRRDRLSQRAGLEP
jgi:hypothetical protein